jgi:3-keto-disaccharide hydrolase
MRLILSMALLTTVAAAQSTRAKLPNEQWVKLFNGRDLSGWVEVGHEKWSVEEGTIHGQGVTKGYGYLKTEKNYKDFELTLRFRCEGDGNSGVFVHTEFTPGTADVSQGMQFEIDQVVGHTGGLYGDGRQWIAWPAPEFEMVLHHNDWNDYLLTVVANRYIARLNGVVILDFTDPTPKSFDGSIALQLHSGGQGNMRFKDIYIHDLSVR